MQKLLAPLALAFFILFAVCAGTSHRTTASISLIAGFFTGLCACGVPTKAEAASIYKSQDSQTDDK